ncbi:MAG: YfcE family phosphodiesterase [Clostridia bacterium]
MKTAIIIADIHNDSATLLKLKPKFDEADYLIFLGDGYSVLQQYFDLSNPKFICVKGNCDSYITDDKTFDIENVKFFITHGNNYAVKTSMLNLQLKAREIGANCVCFGHTHQEYNQKIDDITYLNPGALGFYNTYCYCVIHENKFFLKIVKIV